MTGLLLIGVSVVAFDASTPFPSLYAVVPVGGTVFVLTFANQGNVAGRVLAWKPFVGIGLISYSAYLWHQPMFVFARMRAFGEPSGWIYVALTLLALVVAYFSWRYIEAPFRDKAQTSRRSIFVFSLLASVVVASVGFTLYFMSGLPKRFPPKVLKVLQYRHDYNPRREECLGAIRSPISSRCVLQDGDRGSIAIWGDSHADPIAWQLSKSQSFSNYRIQQLTHGGCVPIIGVERVKNHRCKKFSEKVFDYLKSKSAPSTIIIASRWTMYLTGETFDNREGGVEPSLANITFWPVGVNKSSLDSRARVSRVVTLLKNEVMTLLGVGKRVVLLHEIPEAGWNVPRRMAERIIHGRGNGKPLSTSFAVYKERVAPFEHALSPMVQSQRLIEIVPAEAFCDLERKGRCINEIDGKPLYIDDDHPDSLGALRIVWQIADAMRHRGWIIDPGKGN